MYTDLPRVLARFGFLALLFGFTIPVFAARPCGEPNVKQVINSSLAMQKYPILTEQMEGELGGPFPQKVARLQTEAPTINWIGTRLGPGGFLFAVDCKGKIIAENDDFGAIYEITPGPVLPDIGVTVLVSYISTTGTGIDVRSASIVRILNDNLVVLWKHELSSSIYLQGSSGINGKYHIVIIKDGRRIVVTGVTKIYAFLGEDWSTSPKRTLLSRSAYCWNPKKLYYATCNS